MSAAIQLMNRCRLLAQGLAPRTACQVLSMLGMSDLLRLALDLNALTMHAFLCAAL